MCVSFINRTKRVTEYGHDFLPSEVRTTRTHTVVPNTAAQITAISTAGRVSPWYEDGESPVTAKHRRNKGQGKKRQKTSGNTPHDAADNAGIGVHVVSDALPASTVTPTTSGQDGFAPSASCSDPTLNTIAFAHRIECVLAGSGDFNLIAYLAATPTLQPTALNASS